MSTAIAKESKLRFDRRIYGVKQPRQRTFVGTVQLCQNMIGDRAWIIIKSAADGKHGTSPRWWLTGQRSQVLLNRSLTILLRGNGNIHGAVSDDASDIRVPSVTALGDYLRRADRPRQSPNVPALFLSPAGTRLLYTNVQNTFQRLVRHAGICRVRQHAGRGCTIFVTALQSTPSSTPIATAMIQARDWRSCRLISATSTRFTHIGISRPRRSC